MFSDELKEEVSLLYPEFKNYNSNQLRIKLEDELEKHEDNIIGKVSNLRDDVDLIIPKEDIKRWRKITNLYNRFMIESELCYSTKKEKENESC